MVPLDDEAEDERRPWASRRHDAEGDEERVGLILRTLSVIPFLLTGALGVVALATWLIVLVFGVGIARDSAWSWAAGRPVGEVIYQFMLLLLIGVACAAIIVLSIFATGIGFRTVQPRWFWRVTQGIFILIGLALGFGRTLAPVFMEDIGLTGRDWFFFFGLAVFSVLVTGARRRRQRDEG
jgi:hypothetical protein